MTTIMKRYNYTELVLVPLLDLLLGDIDRSVFPIEPNHLVARSRT